MCVKNREAHYEVAGSEAQNEHCAYVGLLEENAIQETVQIKKRGNRRFGDVIDVYT